MAELRMGCFGSVIVFSESDQFCQRCPLFEQCKAQVEDNKRQLEELLGHPVFAPGGSFWRKATSRKAKQVRHAVTTVKTKTTRVVVEPTGDKSLPVHAQDLPQLKVKERKTLHRWAEHNVDLSLLDKHLNPFDGFITFHIERQLITAYFKHGRMTKKELVAELERSLAASGHTWSRTSVDSHVNFIVGALRACGYGVLKEVA